MALLQIHNSVMLSDIHSTIFSLYSHSEDVLRLGQRDEGVAVPRLPERGARDLGALVAAVAAPSEGARTHEAAARDVAAVAAVAGP